MQIAKPCYYAVIPANVRYDETLRPNAKLLYAEITALCDSGGICTARNDYFSKLYGLSRKTISELISHLAEKEYIKVEVLRDGRGQVTGRKIMLSEAVGPIPKNRDASPGNPGGLPRKNGIPVPKNREDFIGLTIQDKTNTPIVPKGKADIFADYTGNDGELLQALRDFEKMRKQKKKPMTDRAKKMLLDALEKHARGDRVYKLRMLEESVLHCWDTVYPLKDDDPPRGAGGKRYSQGPKLEEW